MKKSVLTVPALATCLLASSVDAAVLKVDGADMPCVAQLITTARAGGAPSKLTRTTNQSLIQRNRQFGCGQASQVVLSLNRQYGRQAFACLAYAFDDTTQGDFGASIMLVPFSEQSQLSALRASFESTNGIASGGSYTVEVLNEPEAGKLNISHVSGFAVCSVAE
jgi:hypothetical protein